MKRYDRIFLLTLLLFTGTGYSAQAQDPILAVIREGVTKAIVAMDLKVQRLQNETIWLQNAQKVLENKLTELRLTQIADWTERQHQLYADYYQELWQVKSAITYYQRVGELVQQQAALVEAYRRTYRLLRRDGNFTAAELDYMGRVYHGILDESVKSLDLLLLVVSSFTTQMSDGQRLEMIHRVARSLDRLDRDLRAFRDQNIRLSLQRAKERHNLEAVQKLYGLPVQ